MAILSKESNGITIDENRIYIKGKFYNSNEKIIDMKDLIRVEESKDSKVHIRKGKGSVMEGAIAGLMSGSGIIHGIRCRRGAEVIKGAKYLTVGYLYHGKEKSFCLDNIQQPEIYEEIKGFFVKILEN